MALHAALAKATSATMKRICAWCGAEMGTVPEPMLPAELLSHGLCTACASNLYFQTGAPLLEFLNSLPVPILAVDDDGVTVAANAKACEVLGRSPASLRGQLGGEVFECVHARLPGGCGRTIHCSGCAIRRSVAETFATGVAQRMVPATLSVLEADSPREVALTLTTMRSGRVVVLRVDRMEKRGSCA